MKPILACGLLGVAICSASHVPAQAVVSYVAGQAALAGQPLSQATSADKPLSPGQTFATGQGTAEVALTPGAMLRMDQASAIRLVAQNERRTEVAVMKGRAEIILNGMREGGELQVDTAGGVQTLLLQNGLFEFDSKAGQLRVFDGKAGVANSASSGWIDVKAGKLLALNGSATQPSNFDRNASDGFSRRFDGATGDYGRGSYGSGEDLSVGYGFSPYGFSGYGYPGFGFPGYGYPGYGFYSPLAFGFYPGFYGGYPGSFGRGFGYRGFGGGRFRR